MLSFDVRADPVGVEQKSPSWCVERIQYHDHKSSSFSYTIRLLLSFNDLFSFTR